MSEDNEDDKVVRLEQGYSPSFILKKDGDVICGTRHTVEEVFRAVRDDGVVECIVVGVKPGGELVFTGTSNSMKDVLMLLERARASIQHTLLCPYTERDMEEAGLGDGKVMPFKRKGEDEGDKP